MTIHKARSEDSYILVDIATNAVAAPHPMTFEELSAWLDDLEGTDEQLSE